MKLKIIFITLILFNLLSCENAAIYKKIDYADDELYIFLKQYIEILKVLNQNYSQENSMVDVSKFSKDEKVFANFISKASSQKLQCREAYRMALSNRFESLKLTEINKNLQSELSGCIVSYQSLLNSVQAASQSSFGMLQFASSLQDIRSYQDLSFLNHIQNSIISSCFRRINDENFLMNLSEEQFRDIIRRSNAFAHAMQNSGSGKLQYSHPNNSSDIFYRQWKVKEDMNDDGVPTYNDLISKAQSLYFMPGDYAVYYSNEIKSIDYLSTIKLDFTTYYGGFFSFIISSICWFVLLMIFGFINSLLEK